MLVTAVAVAVGLAVGALLPPSPHRYARPQARFPLVLAAGVALLLAAPHLGGDGGLYVQVAGYGVVLAGVAANLHLVGLGVLLTGLAANALVIALNSGMPVRADALVEVGSARAAVLAAPGAHRHLETGADKLAVLDDRIPLPLGGQVVAFGDLIIAVGLADAVAHAARRRAVRAAPAAIVVGQPAARGDDAVDAVDAVDLVDLREPVRRPAHLAGAR